MTEKSKRLTQKDGRRLFEQDRDRKLADPRFRKIYAEEAKKKELWLQLAEARHAAGLTQEELAARLGVSQTQVSRMEKRGYESYTLRSLQRYIHALGENYELEVSVRHLNATGE